MARRALSFYKAPGLSATGAETASANLYYGQPRSGKFSNDRQARPSSDDSAVGGHQRRAAPAGRNVLASIARRRSRGRRQRSLYYVSDLRRRQRRAGARRSDRTLVSMAYF